MRLCPPERRTPDLAPTSCRRRHRPGPASTSGDRARTGHPPDAARRAPAGGRPGRARGRAANGRSKPAPPSASTPIEVASTVEERQHHDHPLDDDPNRESRSHPPDDDPRPRVPPLLPHLKRSPPPSAPPSLTAIPVSYFSLILMLEQLPLAAAPPPAPPASCLGCPARFIWQVEEGGSSAKRWTPLPRKPRPDAGFGRRRGGGPLTSKFNPWSSTRGLQPVEINTRPTASCGSSRVAVGRSGRRTLRPLAAAGAARARSAPGSASTSSLQGRDRAPERRPRCSDRRPPR
jgi:hypothetical protein